MGRLGATLHLLLRDHRLALPDDRELLDELMTVRLRESAPGVYRLDHDSGQHDDRAVALASLRSPSPSVPRRASAWPRYRAAWRQRCGPTRGALRRATPDASPQKCAPPKGRRRPHSVARGSASWCRGARTIRDARTSVSAWPAFRMKPTTPRTVPLEFSHVADAAEPSPPVGHEAR